MVTRKTGGYGSLTVNLPNNMIDKVRADADEKGCTLVSIILALLKKEYPEVEFIPAKARQKKIPRTTGNSNDSQ